jgi:deazaflavin-dependent oxidoreductase (nitroreductase family)
MTHRAARRRVRPMFDWKTFNPEVIAEFRANGGKVARFGGLPMVILHTIGARSRKVREVPLIVVLDCDETLIFGTAAGSTKHPDWYFNLRANPRISVEYGDEQFTAEVVELLGAAAEQKIEQQAAATPQFADYMKSAAPRTIPVFTITRA